MARRQIEHFDTMGSSWSGLLPKSWCQLPDGWADEIETLTKHHRKGKDSSHGPDPWVSTASLVQICRNTTEFTGDYGERSLVRILIRDKFAPDHGDLHAHADEALEYLRLTIEEGYFDVLYPGWGDRGLDLFLLVQLLAESLAPNHTMNGSNAFPALTRVKLGALWPMRGGSTARLKRECVALGRMECNVLIIAPSGCGKEAIAQTIHLTSLRDGPFFPVSVPAIPESVFASEAFGTTKNAATDIGERSGFFETAGAGTLFLDEVADLPLLPQAMLLRTIAERRGHRLGGGKDYSINCRILSATNKEQSLYGAQLRNDLRFRLEEQRLSADHLPGQGRPIKALTAIRPQLPLLLAIHLVRSIRRNLGIEFSAKKVGVTLFGDDTKKGRAVMEAVAAASLEWQGNHRELEQICNWAVLRAIRDIDIRDNIQNRTEWLEALQYFANEKGIILPLKLRSRHDLASEGAQLPFPAMSSELLSRVVGKMGMGFGWQELQGQWFDQLERYMRSLGMRAGDVASLLGMNRSTVARHRKRVQNFDPTQGEK